MFFYFEKPGAHVAGNGAAGKFDGHDGGAAFQEGDHHDAEDVEVSALIFGNFCMLAASGPTNP